MTRQPRIYYVMSESSLEKLRELADIEGRTLSNLTARIVESVVLGKTESRSLAEEFLLQLMRGIRPSASDCWLIASSLDMQLAEVTKLCNQVLGKP